jgi:pimeloyl-ACP methyl ester carboxylesterase
MARASHPSIHDQATLPLPPAVSGELRRVHGRAGGLAYYVAGEGPPLLLVHSINAAASAYEVGPIFEEQRRHRRVYAIDLPGFGFSERSERAYTIRLYVDAIHDMLDAIAAECGAAPVHGLAISLASEFVARAATERPDRFRTLTLVTPTGFNAGAAKLRGPPGASREMPGVHAVVSCRLWAQGLYNLLVSRRSVRYFLKRTFGSAAVDEALVEYCYLTAHQPGARHAPYAFLTGRLFAKDIRAVYERLMLPVWVPHATRGDFKDFSGADWARAKPNWTFHPFATGALPHFEQPDTFLAELEQFLSRAEALVDAA